MPRHQTGLLGVLAIGAVLSSSACASEDSAECQAGATSSTEAVQTLLSAAVEGDAERACVVTTEMELDVLEANLWDIASFVDGAGGESQLTVVERPDQQLGSTYYVEVLGPDSAFSVGFEVIQSGGRYLVGVGEVEPGPEATTNPHPRPSAAQSATAEA